MYTSKSAEMEILQYLGFMFEGECQGLLLKFLVSRATMTKDRPAARLIIAGLGS